MYIFEINSLSVASFAIIFSHSEGCLFTLLIVSFIVQKLLGLIRSQSVRLYFFGVPKSLQMVIAAMKLKDTYSLEGKL